MTTSSPSAPSARAFAVLQEVSRRFEEARDRTAEVPAAMPSRGPARLTIGMAAYEEFDGVYFTAEAIRLFHPEVLDGLEIVLVDNHPEGPAAPALASLAQKIPGMRYVPFRAWRGTASRDLVFREASGDVVVCLDSHVLLRPGALAALRDHVEAHPDDFAQGPLLYEDGRVHATHFDPAWGEGMYGQWGVDPRVDGDVPFEISMSGLGVFACRRDRWPGFHPHFRGFGGEEGYIHEKFRQRGGRVVCVPAAAWVHRFARPAGLPYQTTWDDRIRNYVIGWDEIGRPRAQVVDHFREFLGDDVVDPILAEVERERSSALTAFDGIMCIQRDANVDEWPDVWARFHALGVGRIVERLPAIMTPGNHHRGCALSHRAAIAEAKRRGLRHVLVAEEDVVFHDDTNAVVRRALEQLGDTPWDVLYLGGVHRRAPEPVAGRDALLAPTYVTTSHALVYHSRVFDRLLDEIPGVEGATLDDWMSEYVAIDQYLPRRIRENALRAFVVTPHVASQPALLNYEDADLALAERFTIR